MAFVELTSRVDPDGILNLSLPLGSADANREVRITVESVQESLTDEQWQQFIRETEGCIADPNFVRHPQGDFEQREELFP